MEEQKLIDNVAYALHYFSWYKGSIEGKFGLESDGADHGRFRKSKNSELDKAFIDGLEFDDEGNSILKTKEGFPYYRMEDGVFKVDSAIRGFDHLPPSWKEENQKGAQVVLRHLTHCRINNLPMKKFLILISSKIHGEWASRCVQGNLKGYADIVSPEAIEYACSANIGLLTNEEYECLFKDGKEPTSFLDSGLYSILIKLPKDVVKETLGYDAANLRQFDLLPIEEKIKDSRQILYGINETIKDDSITPENKKYFEEQKREIRPILEATPEAAERYEKMCGQSK